MSTATRSPTAPCPRRIRPRAPISRAAPRATRWRNIPRKADYVYNMQRLLRKLETAKSLVPAPIRRNAREKTKYGAIYFGSTSPAMDEALAALEKQGIHLNTLRVRAFPFA